MLSAICVQARTEFLLWRHFPRRISQSTIDQKCITASHPLSQPPTSLPPVLFIFFDVLNLAHAHI